MRNARGSGGVLVFWHIYDENYIFACKSEKKYYFKVKFYFEFFNGKNIYKQWWS
jgi:hypothetical protein